MYPPSDFVLRDQTRFMENRHVPGDCRGGESQKSGDLTHTEIPLHVQRHKGANAILIRQRLSDSENVFYHVGLPLIACLAN